MGMKKVYSCDICRDEVKDTDLYGVCFSNMRTFTLGGYGSTDGVHICKFCAKQLQTHLNTDAIKEELSSIGIVID